MPHRKPPPKPIPNLTFEVEGSMSESARREWIRLALREAMREHREDQGESKQDDADQK